MDKSSSGTVTHYPTGRARRLESPRLTFCFALRKSAVSPYINRFVQPDTIIPNLYNPQDLNRFSYVRNNPIRYTDPSGHETCMDDGYCGNPNSAGYWNKVVKDLSSSYGITFSGKWKQKDKLAALTGAAVVAGALAKHTGMASIDSFSAVFGELTFARSTDDPGYWGLYANSTITFYAEARQWTTLVAHELGHTFNARIANDGGVTPYTTLAQNGIWTVDGEQFAGNMAGYSAPGTGFTCGNIGTQQCFNGEGSPIPGNSYFRERPLAGLSFRHGFGATAGEDFADTFANWATGGFTIDRYGIARSHFMTTNIADWVTSAMGGGQ